MYKPEFWSRRTTKATSGTSVMKGVEYHEGLNFAIFPIRTRERGQGGPGYPMTIRLPGSPSVNASPMGKKLDLVVKLAYLMFLYVSTNF